MTTEERQQLEVELSEMLAEDLVNTDEERAVFDESVKDLVESICEATGLDVSETDKVLAVEQRTLTSLNRKASARRNFLRAQAE